MKRLLILMLLAGSAYGEVEILQKGYYTVVCNGVEISKHSTYRKSLEVSVNQGGQCVIKAPTITVITDSPTIPNATQGTATITLSQPTTRVDGTPLGSTEIEYYTIYASWNEGPEYPILRANQLTFKANLPAGLWKFTATVTDINGLESDRSDPKFKEIPLP